MTKEKCGETFDGSICTLRKGHGGRHVDNSGSGNGPLSWTEQGKERVLAERAASAERKEQQGSNPNAAVSNGNGARKVVQ
jgi:hypothetical protein